LSDEELEELQDEFRRLRQIACEEVNDRAQRRRAAQVEKRAPELLRSRRP
jgi:hypothetical protein